MELKLSAMIANTIVLATKAVDINLNMTDKINIEFNKESAGFILESFKDKYPPFCIFCKKKITKKNLGFVVQKGFVCDNITCIVELEAKTGYHILKKEQK